MDEPNISLSSSIYILGLWTHTLTSALIYDVVGLWGPSMLWRRSVQIKLVENWETALLEYKPAHCNANCQRIPSLYWERVGWSSKL